MIAVDFGDGWRYAYKAQKHRLVDSRVEFPDQPPKYNGVRGEKTDYRGELGDPPPLVELNPDTRRLGDTASDDSNAGAGWSGLDAAIALGDEIERRYAERVVQQRLHQPELRKMTLDHHGTACAYCGLDVPQIIEAAHLVADAEGGEASTENTRPMCPNHHRAFDAGLLLWDGSRFEPADDAPPVGPAPGPEQTPVVSQ